MTDMLLKDCFTPTYFVAAASDVMSLLKAETFQSASTDAKMAGELGVVLKVVEPIRTFVFGTVGEYVGYIGKYEDNLGALHKSLSEVCNKKDDIRKKVKEGNDKLEEITREAASWLKDIRILTDDEELKGLMYKDTQTAKFVVKLMEKRDLKRRISEDSEMQELAIKVMRKLEEEMDECEEEMRKMAEEDYKRVAEVVVEVMKDTIEDFKKLMKEDKNMAVIATRTLKDRDLDKLTKGDQEMEEIIREAGNVSDEEFCRNRKDVESDALLVKIPTVDVGKNTVKEAAKKLFIPLANLVTPLGKLMDDANFKKAVPEADGIKLGLEVIDGLLIRGRGVKKEEGDSSKQHRGCCCCSLSLCNDFHGRYLISKAAELMTKHIQDDFISKCPRDPVTLHIRTVDLKLIPTQFLKGLDSRTQLLDQILEKLIGDQVESVGVFGMGGTGKTTLAKEVITRVKDAFAIKVLVEVSEAPDFVRIQAAIAESIDLPLHDVENVAQRAIRLYNRLISEKEKKILIILDNVWKKLNLDEIGIPDTCKLLFTTRDREVCRVMNVRDVNILEVGVMNTNEARELFKSKAGNQAHAGEYRNLVERLLNKCGGLPLAIVAIANSLKDKDLSSWKKFADDLEKPISSEVKGDYRQTFTILNTSYNCIQPAGKRMFFLLVCLSPLGSSVSIESLMRCGMGLNLFEHVNNLSEAMEQAVTWANELMLASMLVESDVKGDVKIHDIVRDFAISYAAKEEEHKFMVEAIPRWLDHETLSKYTAMSLMSKNDYSRLRRVKACKLQILILKGDLSLDFHDYIFNGMLNLKVLVVSNVNFQPSLPESMRKLKKLRTLCMEDCKLGNIELLGELKNLLVLSLRGSSLENITNEIGNLHELRLLDLGGCTSSKLPLIPTSVLNKLSDLEGLYMYNERQSILEKKSESEKANAIVNIRLPYLNALEMNEKDIKELPFDVQTIKNLDKFRISLASYDWAPTTGCRCSLSLEAIDASAFLKISCFKPLLKKSDYLRIEGSRNFEDVVPLLDQEGFRSLIFLDVVFCKDIKSIVGGCSMSNMVVFPCLESLTLRTLYSLEMVCNAIVSPGSFSNLQTINLHFLNKLHYGLPLVPRNIKEIHVSMCDKLEFIFIEDVELVAIELPFLKTVELDRLPHLISLVGPREFLNSYDDLRCSRPFFSDKIGLPSIELFTLKNCRSVCKLWSKGIHTLGFQNLKDIQISDCELSNVGSPTVFSNLVQLENLSISDCSKMLEVISHEEIGESKIGEEGIVFSQLKSMELNSLESFYRGQSKLVFPKLKTLNLQYIHSMKMSEALFNEKIEFPCLEELAVRDATGEVKRQWDKQSLTMTSNPAPMLRRLKLGNSAALVEIPSIVLKNISFLTLTQIYCQGVNVLFSSSNLEENGGFVWIYSQLPSLEGLKVDASFSVKELFEKEGYNAPNVALTSFCEQLKTLDLSHLPKLKTIPLHLFKSLASLTLSGLKWKYVIETDVLEDLLQGLQFLKIEKCPKMKALVMNVGSQIKLRNLKHLSLFSLKSFIGISSTLNKGVSLLLPSLESLDIEFCHKLVHFWEGSISAPKLQAVSVRECIKLQQLLVGNLDYKIKLPSLRKVSLSWCDNLESISIGSLIAPKLREVELDSCSNMKCFFPGNQNHDGDLQLLSLEVVDIHGCRNLDSFSPGRVVAPKLTQTRFETNTYSMLPFDDLNHFLKEHENLAIRVRRVHAVNKYDSDEEDSNEEDDDNDIREAVCDDD